MAIETSTTSTETTAPATAAPTISIRQFRVSDLPAVTEIFAEGFPEHPSDGSGEMLKAYIQSCLDDDLGDIDASYIATGGNFWVATSDDSTSEQPRVVGMVALEKKSEDGAGELRRMSVKREYRRYGVGKLLVAELEAWAAARGFKSINLWTGAVVTVAQAFYTKLGYVKSSEKGIPEDPKFIIYEYVKQL